MLLEKRAVHILIPVIIVLIINYVISIKKWGKNNENDKNKNRGILPSGLYIGLIWVYLYGKFTLYIIQKKWV